MDKHALQQNEMADKKSKVRPLEICLKHDGGKEEGIITCMAAGVVKVVSSGTADL